MRICMRTTVDVPDALLRRAKVAIAKQGVTFRALIIDALEQSLARKPEPFVLRDASAGYVAAGKDAVSSGDINRAVDDLREPKDQA
jgi:hypothetical protein